MKIAVIYGGISSERDVSIKTGNEIISNLDKEKYEIIPFLIDKKQDVLKIKDLDIDFAYIALHGNFGENGEIQSILETLNIPYSGTDVKSSALCMDKQLTKEIVKNANVRVIDGISLRKGEKINFNDINLGDKIILKPNSGGSSIGIFFATNEEEFNKACSEIFKIDDEIIIEKVINGIEISVPIIGGKVFPTLLIEALMGEYFDYVSKYEKGGAKEEVFYFPEKIQNEIDEFTHKVFYATKCKAFARVDYILSDDKVYFLEINTLPGMTSASLLPKSTKSVGYSYSETLDLLIKESLNK